MTAQIPGELLIFGAFAVNLVAGFAFLRATRGDASYARLANRAYALFTVLVGLAVAYLYFLFYSHNYAFKYVFEYSARDQSNFYILSAFWGGQEGTYLLWLFFNALFGFIIIRKGAQYASWAMVVYSIINLFFLAILIKLSPFALLPEPALDGLGLNPLLRDPWMVIHPPVIFVGYAMAAVPFAIAMAALILNDYQGWARRVFPWVAVTAFALGAGNILGGFWAYKTLGWGGYWGWDPVENSSFVPWVIALALVHGLIVERRSEALRKTNILLTAFVFLLVVYGTFLTRSGVLADFSVHSFTDLGINNLLIGFMVFFVVLTAALFAWRARSIRSLPLNYNFYGREFSLFAGLVMLTLFGLVVLVWTSLPLLTRLVGIEPRAAALSTYNDFALPLATLMAFLLAISPVVDFSEFKPHHWSRKLMTGALVSLALGFGLFYLVLKAPLVFAVIFALIATGLFMYLLKKVLVRLLAPALVALAGTITACLWLGVTDYSYILFFATAAMAAVSNVIALAGYFPARWKLIGGHLTHVGFGLMLIGILASSALSTGEKLVIPRGEAGRAFGREIRYSGMAFDINHPNNELVLSLDTGDGPSEIRPQLYFSERMQGIMRKPYVDRSLLYDLYLAPEQIEPGNTGESLVIRKGETKRIGDIELTFDGYDMKGAHGESMESGMRVAARLAVKIGNDARAVAPALVQEMGTDGSAKVISQPAVIRSSGKEYSVTIEQILADQGAVALSIPGLTDTNTPDRLILDISRKPIINLVWTGAILILFGSLIVYVRRREEMVRTTALPVASKESVPQQATP
ncbi:MAG: cytochrome c biogenesis protein CcsA [Candidatus Zixiibacteriota bacterium]